VANALKALGYDNIRRWVGIGALMGMISSLLVFQYGQARVWFRHVPRRAAAASVL